jgi:hypothetical protein
MKKIDLSQAIGILANVGVIAGIVFLSIEVRQNNEVLEAQSRAYWVDHQAHILETMALNPDLLEIMLNGVEHSESLTALERERVRAIGNRTLAIWQHQFGEMRRGRLAESDIMALQKAVFCTASNDYGTRSAWEVYGATRASSEYRRWFEDKIADCE